MATQAQPRPYNQAYLPNGGPTGPSGPAPGAAPLLPNQGRVIQQGSIRVLCIADVRGNLRSLNDLARDARANYIVHTGDFGFYDERSLDRIAEKTLRHVAQYSPLFREDVKRQIGMSAPQPSIKERFPREQLPLSELPQFLNKTYTLDVPVYTVWGACEDVQVLEKLRSGEYKIDNLHIIDEAHSRLLEVGGIKLRLLGLGGAVVMHKLFDNGEGRTTIAGGQGTMWTTLLQMGELVDTANRVYDPTETRVFVTHASPAREGLLNQLSVTLKADFSISAGLHFRYGSSYNEFSVNPTLDHYRGKLAASKASFNDVWETVKLEVEPAVMENESQQRLLHYALEIVSRMPSVANGGNPFGGQIGGPGTGVVDESAFKNMWNFNLADAAYGWLVLDIEGGRIGTEMRAQGFNFAHRGGKAAPNQQAQATPLAPSTSTAAPSGQSLPTPSGPPTGPQNRPPPGPGPQQHQQGRGGPAMATPPAQPQSRVSVPQPAKSGPSPVPATPKEPVKPATPQPTATAGNATPSASAGPEKAIPSEVKPNGTAQAQKPAEPKADTPQAEKKPSQALFMRNVKTEDDARGLIPEADRAKIARIERVHYFYIVHFSSPEEMQAVFSRIPAATKKRDPSNADAPIVSVYMERTERRPFQHSGAGSWQASTRGGAQPGYRSASDSEGGRGARGGRGGRGGRGSERGRGRGGRGGGFKGTSDAASPSPAPATAGGDS